MWRGNRGGTTLTHSLYLEHTVLSLTITVTIMEMVVLNILFIACVSTGCGKHVYVQYKYGWHDAQKHCRDHYIDLFPITTFREERKLKNTAGEVNGKFWIGLYRRGRQWKWIGGENATYTPWDINEPDDYPTQNYASACWNDCNWKGWHNYPSAKKMPFFCFNLIVMEYKLTWEKALRRCRKTGTTLTSLNSETQNLLALSKIQQDNITKPVWIGLRYLADRWLWVNGEPLVYQAWSQGDKDHQCPIWKRCGALTKEGLWVSLDCQDKLHFICY